ncbi:HAD-IC family P-type ATPase [Actinoalloteichus caeruleus]|uniref:Cation-transporting ATPase E n=1 Tax=Actinoalloteichus caeruleus DSM 43889 TaxID=1120930 RepID=A0ABT1JN55_ACTCY|nr:HAD-IC family P-type ATPase [Actinoalloteichus caeruleus]MCP2333960.1 cation-transporting ATPase E [Actinoalloteichus caeruleus DSM 43889]
MSDESGSATVDPQRGLTEEQVATRVAEGRTNDVPARASRTVSEIVRANVLTRFNAIIGVLFAIILVIGPIQDGLFGFVIVVNTAIGIVQELRAKRTLERLAITGEARPRVVRDGRAREVPPARVVLDDVVELGAGDQVVVDGVVTTASGLEIDESLLTGEADPVVKEPGDRVLSGSFVAAGSGRYQATRVGREAYAARLAEEASRFTLVHSELRSGIDRILRFITYLLVPAGALIIYSQFTLADEALPDAVRGMVAALVPMVPEGLVLLTSIAFALGVIRLGRRHCLVRELPAIEGLARVDVVCADKTGTLTENGMRLADLRPVGVGGEVDPGLVLAALAATDPRPNASLLALREAFPEPPGWGVAATVPFSSARKWSGARFTEAGDWVLGAPDVLLPGTDPLLAEVGEAASQGLRVLLLGRPAGAVDDPAGPGVVEPAALVVLEQRIRSDARDTLRYFAEQGVTVKIISGDNATSVGAVAARLDLPNADRPLDARGLPTDPRELAEAVDGHSVFGRVTPAQKQDMVVALRSRGHTVAMTGDGVNDVLALKDADIGVAMGSGSPASRSVARIVLLDNRFATLPHVVAEGRRVIGNIERVANLFLTKTVYSVLLAIMVGIAQVPFPFLPRHLTLIGALTIGVPAFFLALAPNAERARPGFVNRVMRLALPAGVIAATATFVTYWWVSGRADGSAEQHGTATLVTLYVVATWVLVIIARPYTWWKVVLVAGMVGLFLLVLAFPSSRAFFALDPGGVGAVLTALAVAGVAVVLVEVAWSLDGWLRSRPS